MTNPVQLGFSVQFEDQAHRKYAGHHLSNWRDWDGGQIGGRPTWLQPRELPKNPIRCGNCKALMSFVCQFYAPAGEVNAEAFHRSLYVFACPCTGCARTTTGSVRVFRAQLPKQNPFFPEDEDITWTKHSPEAWDLSLCEVCGQRAKGKCPVQGVQFCCKQHQKEHKKYVFGKQEEIENAFLPSVLADSELVVEEEPPSERIRGEIEAGSSKPLFAQPNDASNEDDDEDRDLEQEDLNEMTGATVSTVSKDPFTMAFYSRIKDRPNVQEQCMRYLRWPDQNAALATKSPLWISEDNRPTQIPCCPLCGADRRFEFQLMPQMLHFLLKQHKINKARSNAQNIEKRKQMKDAIQAAASVIEQAPKHQVPPTLADAKDEAIRAQRKEIMFTEEISWGVVAVYTCTASCGDMQASDADAAFGAYREEFAWKQPSLD